MCQPDAKRSLTHFRRGSDNDHLAAVQIEKAAGIQIFWKVGGFSHDYHVGLVHSMNTVVADFTQLGHYVAVNYHRDFLPFDSMKVCELVQIQENV